MSREAWGEPDDSAFEAAIEAGWLDPADLSKALIDVMNERDRQWNEEHFDPAHDDQHQKGELARAAATYALAASFSDFFRSGRNLNDKIKREYENLQFSQLRQLWPWDWCWWKPTDRRRDLVKAGALIIAEIERLDRAAKAEADRG